MGCGINILKAEYYAQVDPQSLTKMERDEYNMNLFCAKVIATNPNKQPKRRPRPIISNIVNTAEHEDRINNQAQATKRPHKKEGNVVAPSVDEPIESNIESVSQDPPISGIGSARPIIQLIQKLNEVLEQKQHPTLQKPHVSRGPKSVVKKKKRQVRLEQYGDSDISSVPSDYCWSD